MALTVNYNEAGLPDSVPTYLFDHTEAYQRSPHDAALEWFSQAHFGLSVFFGLYSLVGQHEDVQERTKIPQEQYSHLTKRFEGKNFDAIDIVELAIAAGARYLLFPACYDDGFCLYHSQLTSFTSVHSAAQRDFLGELASTCEYHGLGLCLEYSFAVNHHQYPDGLPATPEEHEKYLDFVKGQLHELLTSYGPIAAICFGGLRRLQSRQPAMDLQDCYDLIHHLQPNTLVSCRQGYHGTEDFFSVAERMPQETDAPAIQGFLPQNTKAPVEIRQSMTPGIRGYCAEMAGKHRKGEEIWELMRNAHRADANLLLNTALMPDGSLDLEDINTLLDIGKRLEAEGRPE